MHLQQHSDQWKIATNLADGFSKQAKFSNQVWFSLILASAVVIFPDATPDGRIKLPFSLGAVDPDTFKIAGYYIITILMITFCQTCAVAHIAVQLSHRELEKLKLVNRSTKAREIFDLHVISTISRVAPLARLLGHGKFGALYYCLLKLVAISVIYAIPSLAIYSAFIQLTESATILIIWLTSFTLLITCAALIQVLYTELRYILNVARRFWFDELTT